jgi:two-component system, cell cycle sensor histidine kinase and response regulator CckA
MFANYVWREGRWFRISPSAQKPTVLVVEDAEVLLKMVASMLRANGYEVLEAGDGEEALAVFERECERIDLILTDVIMPQMNGRELADRISELRRECPVVFMSGYTEDPVVEGVINGRAGFLHKPFTARTLVEVVQRNLECRRGAGDWRREPT